MIFIILIILIIIIAYKSIVILRPFEKGVIEGWEAIAEQLKATYNTITLNFYCRWEAIAEQLKAALYF